MGVSCVISVPSEANTLNANTEAACRPNSSAPSLSARPFRRKRVTNFNFGAGTPHTVYLVVTLIAVAFDGFSGVRHLPDGSSQR